MGNMKRNLPDSITIQTLAATYRREASRHPDWPDTFEGVLANPLLRGVLVALSRSQVPAYVRRRAERWNGLSGKDYAAGEKPDDQ